MYDYIEEKLAFVEKHYSELVEEMRCHEDPAYEAQYDTCEQLRTFLLKLRRDNFDLVEYVLQLKKTTTKYAVLYVILLVYVEVTSIFSCL